MKEMITLLVQEMNPKKETLTLINEIELESELPQEEAIEFNFYGTPEIQEEILLETSKDNSSKEKKKSMKRNKKKSKDTNIINEDVLVSSNNVEEETKEKAPSNSIVTTSVIASVASSVASIAHEVDKSVDIKQKKKFRKSKGFKDSLQSINHEVDMKTNKNDKNDSIISEKKKIPTKQVQSEKDVHNINNPRHKDTNYRRKQDSNDSSTSPNMSQEPLKPKIIVTSSFASIENQTKEVSERQYHRPSGGRGSHRGGRSNSSGRGRAGRGKETDLQK